MASDTIPISLIRTKLHRPPNHENDIHRQRLLDRLDQRLQRPLTLVVAPAGYGKTTLVSCWLVASSRPSAWVSLDKNDNDLHQYLSYFLAAVQTIFPDAGREIQGMVNALTLYEGRSCINALFFKRVMIFAHACHEKPESMHRELCIT